MTTHVKETKAFKPTQESRVVLRGQGTPRWGHPYEGVGDASRKIIIQPPEATSLILVGLKP